MIDKIKKRYKELKKMSKNKLIPIIKQYEKIYNAKEIDKEGIISDILYNEFREKDIKKAFNLKEETTTADIPNEPTGNMADGRPFFNCDHNEKLFWDLHTRVRGKGQWYKTHYQNEPVANWARANKGKNFYLQYKDMFRKIKAK